MNEEKELIKFINDPTYREKALTKAYKKQDKKYEKDLNLLSKEHDQLVSKKYEIISKNSRARLDEGYADGNLIINNTEGKIYLNANAKNVYLFSSIGATELNFIQGARIESNETTKGKKNASLGGAMLGGLVGGSLGATIGGSSLGKTTYNTSSVTNQIATCQHLGVFVQLDDQVQEIVLINSQIDQASNRFIEKYKEAQTIIIRLNKLAKTPVPTDFIPVEEMDNVIECQKKIDEKLAEYNNLKNKKPPYTIPDIYRIKDKSNLSDSEYLQYLKENDEKRLQEEKIQRLQKLEDEARLQEEKIQRLKNLKDEAIFTGQSVKQRAKKVANSAWTIVKWIIGLWIAIAGSALICSKYYVAGGINLCTGIFFLPAIQKKLKNEEVHIPNWLPVTLLCIGLVISTFFM